MDDKLFHRNFSITNPPNWPCPTCHSGVLCLDESDFHKSYDKSTAAQINEAYFDADMISYVFHGMLKCGRCKEVVVFCGTGGVEEDYDESERGWSYYDYFTPKFFSPSIRLINIDHIESVPYEVMTMLDKACQLYWSDIDACANRIRTTVELILDNLKVERKRGLTLHDRILKLDPEKYADVRIFLEAVKWIGNDGSHELDKLHKDSVREGFRMIEYCIAKLYPRPPIDPTQMLEMAKAINDARGQVGILNIKMASAAAAKKDNSGGLVRE